MKINLIGMVLNNAGRKCFEGALIGDDGKPLSAADSLHILIMEYAKVINGGVSEIVTASREVLTKCSTNGEGQGLHGKSPTIPAGRKVGFPSNNTEHG